MSEGNGTSTAESRIAEKEQRRAERKAATAAARAEQYEKDLEHIEALEIQHGDDRVGVLTMVSFVAGLPTVIVVATPQPLIYKRFRSQIANAQDNGARRVEALDLLASSCVLYPDRETYAKMRESWPAIHDDVALEAIRLQQRMGKV